MPINSSDAKRLARAKRGARASACFMPVMGITWVFGLLAIEPNTSIVWTFLFTVCTGAQGILIFAFHFIGDRTVRRAFGKCMGHSSTAKTGSSRRSTGVTGLSGSNSHRRCSVGPASDATPARAASRHMLEPEAGETSDWTVVIDTPPDARLPSPCDSTVGIERTSWLVALAAVEPAVVASKWVAPAADSIEAVSALPSPQPRVCLDGAPDAVGDMVANGGTPPYQSEITVIDALGAEAILALGSEWQEKAAMFGMRVEAIVDAEQQGMMGKRPLPAAIGASAGARYPTVSPHQQGVQYHCHHQHQHDCQQQCQQCRQNALAQLQSEVEAHLGIAPVDLQQFPFPWGQGGQQGCGVSPLLTSTLPCVTTTGRSDCSDAGNVGLPSQGQGCAASASDSMWRRGAVHMYLDDLLASAGSFRSPRGAILEAEATENGGRVG